MLFNSMMKLLELLNPMKKINIDLLLACLLFLLKVGDHCYRGLCDVGASVSSIPFTLYQEIMNDSAPTKVEDIDVTIKLANRDTISLIGVVRDVEVLCGKIK